MRLHEYQAKRLFAQYGLTTPVGVVVNDVTSMNTALDTLGPGPYVAKAQIHAGARGQAGGVCIGSAAEIEAHARRLLDQYLITTQTGPGGLLVQHLLLEQPVVATAELYVACTIDRLRGGRVLLASRHGGTDVEAQTPPLCRPIDALRGFPAYAGRELACALGLSGGLIARFGDFVATMARLAVETDALLVEINPLMVTAEDRLVAADGKIEIDDNALYRQSVLAAERDPLQENPQDERARAKGLQYIALDGDIGCLVNGAGLAMATMDLIAQAGGQPANFLDVGGGTSAQKVADALAMLVAESRVHAVLVNIFGGIVRCDLIAEGLIAAARHFGRPLPIVVRLVGTRSAEGQALLAESGLAVQATDSLREAAQWAVRAARTVA